MITLTENYIKRYKLIDDNPGRQSFWRFLVGYMSTQMFASIMFVEDFDKRIGGFFANDLYAGDQILKDIKGIVLPQKSVKVCTDEGQESVKFNTDRDFATFLHEASHYLHVVKDNGSFHCPFLQGHDMSAVRDMEYEAGWRSLETSHIYGMFPPDDRTVLEMNLKNMLHYVKIENLEEFKGNDQLFRDRQVTWIKSVKKFSDIHDYKVVI